MVKKEKAFQVPPRSLLDIVSTNDIAQLSISVKGFNPHDTSPGQLLLSSKNRPTSADGLSTIGTAARGRVGTVTAAMVAFERDAGGFTALHIAAAHGHLEMVKILVEEYHSSLAATSDSGKSPLYVAVEQGHQPIVEYLLQQGGNDIKLVTVDEQRTIFQCALEKQYHGITVLLNDALLQCGYQTNAIDPIDAALGGDLFFFALEKARIDADVRSKSISGHDAYGRIAFARDEQRNTILATIANQSDVLDVQLAVVRYLLSQKLFGDVNQSNSSSNTALHNLACSCAEKDLDVEALQRRIALLRLILEHGGDARRTNAAGLTPSQCTENPVLKLHLIAAEKRSLFQDSYIKRNQVPLSERSAFALACKELKKAYRKADTAAAAALLNPQSVVDETAGSAPGSAKPSPKPTPRGKSATSLKLRILEANSLPQGEGQTLDVFVAVALNNTVVFQTAIAPNTAQPRWTDADVAINVAVGDTLQFSVVDKELPSASSPDTSVGSALVQVDDSVLAGGEHTLPLKGAGEATLRIAFELVQ